MKVLLVDDNEPRVEILKAWMLELGIAKENILTADNTTSARSLITRNYFDVLLLDVVLPKRHKEQARWLHGIELLDYVASSARAKKPEKIIGITAHTNDISAFRDKFEKHCLSVIEIKDNTGDWRSRLSSAFNYTRSSKIARAHAQNDLAAITVHGIRTFGQWQERLKRIVHAEADFIKFHTYKYGYFAVFFFAIPYFQNKEVSKLQRALLRLFETQPNKRFIVFGHSFGTFLIAKALARISASGTVLNIKAIVLSGSVLKSDYDWGFLDNHPDLTLINECGNGDGILCLSEAFIPMTGMAGRTGFYGLSSDSFINRYYCGGHSLYFKGDDFMRQNWLPLFSGAPTISNSHQRPDPNLLSFVFEQTANYIGRFGLIAAIAIGALAMTFR